MDGVVAAPATVHANPHFISLLQCSNRHVARGIIEGRTA